MEMELGEESLASYAKNHKDKYKTPPSEEQCAAMMKGLLQGVEYMHDVQNFLHRDLKPENVLLSDYEDLSQVKIIDFGLACKGNAITPITDFLKCGTFLYKPPE